MSIESQLNGYRKKQELIDYYFKKIRATKTIRNVANQNLKVLEKRFSKLIGSNTDVDELNLFENIDDLLIEINENDSDIR